MTVAAVAAALAAVAAMAVALEVGRAGTGYGHRVGNESPPEYRPPHGRHGVSERHQPDRPIRDRTTTEPRGHLCTGKPDTYTPQTYAPVSYGTVGS